MLQGGVGYGDTWQLSVPLAGAQGVQLRLSIGPAVCCVGCMASLDEHAAIEAHVILTVTSASPLTCVSLLQPAEGSKTNDIFARTDNLFSLK